MKLPTTRRACAKLYRYRRLHNRALTKLDMYLGGMICCSEEEFFYRKPITGRCLIGGSSPCLCVYEEKCEANGAIGCVAATKKTLQLPWDAPLYGGNKE